MLQRRRRGCTTEKVCDSCGPALDDNILQNRAGDSGRRSFQCEVEGLDAL